MKNSACSCLRRQDRLADVLKSLGACVSLAKILRDVAHAVHLECARLKTMRLKMSLDGFQNYQRQKRAELLIELIATIAVAVFLIWSCK